MLHDYSEDQLVEQPAIEIFEKLGWNAVSAIYKRKCSAVFEHIYENYSDKGGSVYCHLREPSFGKEVQ